MKKLYTGLSARLYTPTHHFKILQRGVTKVYCKKNKVHSTHNNYLSVIKSIINMIT